MKKRILTLILCLVMGMTVILSGCGGKSDANATASGAEDPSGPNDNSIVIWTSGEDYRNEYYLSSLKEKFPEYDFTLEYMNTSSIAAKVMEEGENCECDIILSEEYGYLTLCEQYLAELTDFDYSPFLDELVPESHKFTPETKNSGCIILNPAVLADRDLPAPTSYEDLLDPQYEGLISMPSPASSGTGYMFLRQLTNEWGEDEAFAYFEKLSDNILQYTSSGSGPVNALIQGEAAIGLGMTSQAVTEINEGVDLQIMYFEEGSPYSMYGNAVLANSADRACVMEAFNYLSTDLCKDNNEMFFPDQIFKDFAPVIENYPENVTYGDMSNDTMPEKERLLEKWTFS